MSDSSDDVTYTSPGFDAPWLQYEWLVIMGAMVSFGMAWGIGANDVANAFGTTVGARTITLWQACLIAAIFEFAGAIGLGGEVTKTVAGSITSPAYFANVPEVFAFGMLCALTAGWIWLTVATYLELAVSTTHTIIGAIMGFGLVYGGKAAIVWSEPTDSFPYVKGLVPIIISWFTSPLIAAIVAAVLLILVRTLILRRHNSHILAFWALPPLVFITIFVNVFFVLYKGAKNALQDWSANQALWVAAVVSGGSALVAMPVTWVLKNKHQVQLDKLQNPLDMMPQMATSKDWDVEVQPGTWWAKFKAKLLYSLTVDVYEDTHKDARVAAMHSAAEVFDPRTEEVFKYLQVFSSCCVSFAHGANDVANAIGPFAAIWYVYQKGAVASTVPTPQWILALGGMGIVVGLGTYGYKIIKVLGVKMAKMTPSRGFCAELSVSFTVSVASVYGLPISTTHCIVGAELGVGTVEGITSGTNWLLFAKTVCAWIVTLVIAGTTSAAIFAFGSYSPCLNDLGTLGNYQTLMHDTIQQAVTQLNATNYGNLATIKRFDYSLNQTLYSINTTLTQISQQGAKNDNALVSLSQAMRNIYISQTIPVVGFQKNATRNDTSAIVIPAI